jgi:hypothetical protein
MPSILAYIAFVDRRVIRKSDPSTPSMSPVIAQRMSVHTWKGGMR